MTAASRRFAKVLLTKAMVVMAVVSTVLVPGRSSAAPGDLDPSFGTGGVAILPIGVHSYANAVVIQGDGKILLAGYAYTGGVSGDMMVARLDSLGALDAGFGSGGVVTLPAGKQSIAYALAIQPDDKIVVAGGVFVAADVYDYDFRLARLLPADGQLDSGFGSGGVVVTPSAGTIGVTSLALQPDGKILAGGDGKRKVTAARNPNRDFAVLRYLGDGTSDTSFGIGGRVTLSMGKRIDIAKRLLLQPDGRVVLAGYATGPGRGSMVSARLAANGDLDRSFGGGGRRKLRLVTRLEFAEDAALLADGRIVLAGLSLDPSFLIPQASTTLARLTSSGKLDGTFGSGGASTVAPDAGAYHYVRRIALQTDGSIVAAGSAIRGSGSPTSSDVLLMRFLPGGALDASFGTGGAVRTSFTDQDELFAVALQPDGGIVVAGVGLVSGQSRTIVARYLP